MAATTALPARNGGTPKWVQQFEQEVWPADKTVQELGKQGEELELASTARWPWWGGVVFFSNLRYPLYIVQW